MHGVTLYRWITKNWGLCIIRCALAGWTSAIQGWAAKVSNRQMIDIRPIWALGDPLPVFAQAPINSLIGIEKNAVGAINQCIALSDALVRDPEEQAITFLQRSAKIDLVAGCELARCGYLKQAYSLWRSWFEQSLFYLYFLEAPVHKAAWKVSDEVTLEDNPQYRLMLHQLLTDSGDRHAFAIVYNERFNRMMEALKVSQVPKAHRPVPRATKILTMLSQGVHGTYQPSAANSIDQASAQLQSHCLPILQGALDCVVLYWLLLLTSHIDIPPEILVKLRDNAAQVAEIAETGLEEPDKIAALGPLFKRAFGNP